MSFQSTRPIRGATAVLVSEAVFEDISIHAPHTGRDGAKHNYYICSNKFQSTRPIRGATHRRGRQALQDHISIHAPHTGRDLADKTVCATLNRISIHAPHTGRDWG